MKYNGPKVKLSKRLGIALTPRAERAMARAAERQGGRRRRPAKMSDYGKQLLEKQRLRFQYNIHERQLRRYYQQASRKTGNTADLLIQTLESRLDALVLRAGFAKTIYAARQFVGHGHIEVNGKKVDIPSYLCQPGDKISVRSKSQKQPGLQDALDNANPPSYVKLNKEGYTAELLSVPERDDIPVICDVPVVVEFYSR